MAENNGSSVSLPSFRNGIEFDIHSLNFGGTKAMIKATKGDDIDVMEVMLYETLKREFPNVLSGEVDKLEQEDYITLMKLVTKANAGMDRIGQIDNDGESQDVEKSPDKIIA